MTPTIPSFPEKDGDVTTHNWMNSPATSPKLYFVNGIQNSPHDHALTASLLSIICEHPVHGVYNLSKGFVRDIGQCLLDYTQNATARVSSNRKLVPGKKVNPNEIKQIVEDTIKGSVVWNEATVSLFKEVASNYGRKTMIVAHSQGNLITSNALFVIEHVFGSDALQNVRVYSLASPSPAWPLGLRYTNGGGGRQENAFMNDVVALLRPHNAAAKVGVGRYQNAGDFRTHPGAGPISRVPHGVQENLILNFLKSIRGDLGKSRELSDDFFDKASKKAEEAIKLMGTQK